MQQPQNTLVQEIILGIVAGPMAIAAPVLLYLGTVNFGGALTIWGIAAGLVVGKLALNAPSPTQQQQIGTLQAQQNAQATNLQGLVQYALGLFQSLQVPAPVASPQAQQTPTPQQVQPSVLTPVVPPEANPVAVSNPGATATLSTLTPALPHTSAVSSSAGTGTVTTPPPQFKSFTIPDVSAPYPAVGQGIPLGQ